jgi:hypothetical protein
MKKKTTTAILLSTTMMLALMGCGAASSDTDYSASVAEVNTETNTTDDDTSKETDADTDASSDSASADSSESSGTTTASSDDSFEYNGQTLSILDDLQTTLDKLNSAFPNEAQEISDKKTANDFIAYNYDPVNSGEAQIDIFAFDYNGKQTVGQISIIKESFKTPRGIGVGSSSDDIIKAYGEPTTKAKIANGIASMYKYKFDKYNLSFFVDNGKVDSIYYFHPDYPEQ